MAARTIERMEPAAEAGWLRHNYARHLAELIAAGGLDGVRPGLFRLVVTHQEGCRLFAGGHCDCKPSFELEEV